MRTARLARGSIDPFTLFIAVICISVGGYYALRSKVIDSPPEQTAEAILRVEGIDIDFSAEKKKDRDANLSQVQSQTDGN